MNSNPFLYNVRADWIIDLVRLTMNTLWSIIGPSATTIKGVQVFNITVKPFLRILAAILLESKVGKNAEPEPVSVGHAESISHDSSITGA
jgi:hypothetical protein